MCHFAWSAKHTHFLFKFLAFRTNILYNFAVSYTMLLGLHTNADLSRHLESAVSPQPVWHGYPGVVVPQEASFVPGRVPCVGAACLIAAVLGPIPCDSDQAGAKAKRQTRQMFRKNVTLISIPV